MSANHVLSHVSDNAGRILIHTTTGALVSGTTGGLGCLLHNIMHRQKIDKKILVDYLKKCDASEQAAELIWNELLEKNYIDESNRFTQKCEHGIIVESDETKDYSKVVNDVYQLTKDVWRDVWESAAESAALGGMLTSVVSSTRIMNKHTTGKTVNKSVRNFIIQSDKIKKTTEPTNDCDWLVINQDDVEEVKNPYIDTIEEDDEDDSSSEASNENVDVLKSPNKALQ